MSELFRSFVRLDDLSGNFSVLISCKSRLQALLLLLFLLLRAGFSTEWSRSIAGALHSTSFIGVSATKFGHYLWSDDCSVPHAQGSDMMESCPVYVVRQMVLVEQLD